MAQNTRNTSDYVKVATIAAIVVFYVPVLGQDFIDRITAYNYVEGNIQIRTDYRIYLAAFIFGVFSFCAIPFILNRTFRLLFSILAAFAIAADVVSRRITSSSLSKHDIETYIISVAELESAFFEYYPIILSGVTIFILILLIFSKQPKLVHRFDYVLVTVNIAAISLTYYALYQSRYQLNEFPAPYVMPGQVLAAVLIPDGTNVEKGNPKDIPLKHSGVEKIVFIMDESIRGDYMQINDQRFDNTPYLDSFRNLQI